MAPPLPSLCGAPLRFGTWIPQGAVLWGEERGPGQGVPSVLDHPLALGARQVVFLPPQCIGVKPEGQAIV